VAAHHVVCGLLSFAFAAVARCADAQACLDGGRTR
jgi:hypothetical protein